MIEKTFSKRFASLFALLPALMLGSCTGSGGNKSAASAVFDISMTAEPPNLNPFTYQDLYAQFVFNYTYESLLTRDSDTYEWKPLLAERWEESKDGKTFTFYLRKDAQWSDGKPVTAEDVKFSYDAIFDDAYLAARQRSYYAGISKVEIVDPLTVRIHAKDTYFGNFSSAASMTIAPKHIFGDPKVGPTINTAITGSGPYVLEKWERGKRIVLKRNDAWWGRSSDQHKNQYLFDRVAYRFVQGQELAVQMLEKGDLDFLALSPESFVERTKSAAWSKDLVKVQTSNDDPGAGFAFVAWNLKRAPFDNRNVRVALSHLMNRELMNEKFRYGMSSLATGPWERTSMYADPKVEPLEFNPSKAKELLTKEGWTDSNKDGTLDKMVGGKRVDFKFSISFSNKEMQKYFTIYKEDLKKQGIDMTINIVEWNSFMKLLDETNFDAVSLAWGGGSVDLDPKQIWHSENSMKGGSNFIHYKNPEVDRLIDVARMKTKREERIPLFQEIYRKIAADAPYVFLFNTKYALYGVNKQIKRPKDTYRFEIGSTYWLFDGQELPVATPAAAVETAPAAK